MEESEPEASSTTSVSSSSLWRVVERASWPLEMLSSRSRSLMTSLDSWVRCCVVLHQFHNRLYNHGEGPY